MTISSRSVNVSPPINEATFAAAVPAVPRAFCSQVIRSTSH